MIKTVLFDVDGVLLDSFEANLKFYQDLLTRGGYDAPTLEEYKKFFHIPLLEGIRMCAPAASETEVRALWQMGRSREVPYRTDLIKIPEYALETLAQLENQYLLGVVTSRGRDSIFESPELAVFKKYFQVAISYDDTEKHKPDPEPLLLAASKLDIPPQKAIYVGDAETDFRAARGAGMKFIHYSREILDGVDACTASFKDLPGLIKSLSQNA